jgi:hypothetical protein
VKHLDELLEVYTRLELPESAGDSGRSGLENHFGREDDDMRGYKSMSGGWWGYTEDLKDVWD